MLGAVSAALQPAGAGAGAAGPLRFSIFSKHLHWLDWSAAAAAAGQIGFAALDLTVRKGGHVAPERAAEDLPKAVAAVRKVGLEVSMITTDIADAGSPHAAAILETMTSLGIRHYRFGGFRYRLEQPLPEQVNAFRVRLRGLLELNAKYGACAMYHTHSGVGQVGASMWDLWMILNGYDPKLAGFNYDIGHATAEGGYGGWIHSLRLAAPYLRGVALKDFVWAKTNGEWRPQWRPVGEGMVNFPKFFGMLKEIGFNGPLQVHYEYKLGGAETGQATLTGDRNEILARMKQDLDLLRARAGAAGLM
jgi:sugar phosphate isomerase/epimerase